MDDISRATDARTIDTVATTAGLGGWDGSDATVHDQTDGPLRELLAGHVPISLIMDLAMPAGPHSRELLESEGSPDTAWWEPR